MAPVTYEQKLTTTPKISTTVNISTNIMSSPTIKALLARISTAANSVPSTSSLGNGYKTVYVGKDQHPVSISALDEVSAPAWKKAAGFDELTRVVFSLADTHEVADLVALISQELPIATNVAFQEAHTESVAIMKSAFDIRNLSAAAFINNAGFVIKLQSEDLDDRPEGIGYFRFHCDLDPAVNDKRVMQPAFNFQFSLKLPQHVYHVSDKRVEVVGTPRKPVTSGIGGLFEHTPRQLFGTEGAQKADDANSDDDNDVPTSPQASAASTLASPKMRFILESGGKTKSGYFGSLDFLESQSAFHSTFGLTPTLLPAHPINKTEIKQEFQKYCDRCKLDIYLNLCFQDYVGSDNVDTSLNVQEVSRKITSLRQAWKDTQGRAQMDTPDELFNKYLQLSASLPQDVQEWPLQLCTAYYSALSPSLSEKMALEQFKMPALIMLTTKSKQLEALRVVRAHAATCFKVLEDEESRMNKMLRAMIGSKKGNVMNTQYTDESQNGPASGNEGARSQVYFQRSMSQAETTIQQYKNGPAPTIPTKTDSKTGIEYPFDESNNYVSRFPVGFQGCYMCGSQDHFKRTDCPDGNTQDRAKRKLFFADMHAHKPHTRRSNDEHVSITHLIVTL
jgi:hypothetical protein